MIYVTIIGRKGGNIGASSDEIKQRIVALIDFLLLKKNVCGISMDTETFYNYGQGYVSSDIVHAGDLDYLAQNSEHYGFQVVVFGGDGTLLNVARTYAKWDKQVDILGINHGKVGFLTDLPGNTSPVEIYKILTGDYDIEHRAVLRVWNDDLPQREIALNEVLINRVDGKILDFEVYVDDALAYRTRADGVMVSTPTGSTAYAMSAGAPIIHPSAKVLEIVPMMPQTMSYRPLIINDTSSIKIKLIKGSAKVFADSIELKLLAEGESISVKKSNTSTSLIHPQQYDYFNTLRTKLNWHLEPGK